MEKEIWKPIKDYEGIYEVSSLGRVRSLDRMVDRGKQGSCIYPGVMLKPMINHKGYECVDLRKYGCRKGAYVHRLVAEQFIPRILNKTQVNHIDGNKRNNEVSNLEWVDNSENQLHAYALGLNKRSELAGRPKRKVAMINDENEVIRTFDSLVEASKQTGIHNISAVCRKIRPKAGGFVWKFI